MPIKPCIGGKSCRRYDCRQRCKGWFGGMDELERACKGRCNGDSTSFSKEDFLCSGQWVDDGNIILAYGYDPCPNSGRTTEEILDPLGDRAREDERLKTVIPIVLALIVLIAAGLGILYVVRK